MIVSAFMQSPVCRWCAGSTTLGVGRGVGMGFVMVLAAFVLALKAFIDARRVRIQLGGLTQQFTMLDRRVAGLAEEFALLRGTPSPEAAPAPEEVAPPPEPAPVAAETAIPEEPVVPPAPPVSPAAPAPWQQWEQKLVENWLVWLGGAAIALGGVFLVKLSIDYGLMTPLVRVVLGIMLGIGLSIGAEWVRRHDLAGDAEPGAASDVPQALAAAGAATVFASLYAAHALYGFLPAGLAFALLAATAGATVAQSLRHGPLVAALGLVGAFIVPLLVTSPTPHALPLFAYLAVVTAGVLALLRHRAWWWLASPSLGGAIGWVALWLASAPDIETPVVALYLLVQFGLFVAFRRGIVRVGFLAGIADTPIVRVVTRSAFWAIAAGLFLLAQADGFGTTSVGAAILATVGLMILAYRDSQLD